MPVFFSLDPNFFKNHANSCTIQNGTTVYSNHSIPVDCSCVAPILADSDFAGPGIIASFVFLAWLTIAVATVPAFYAIRQSWRNTARRKNRIWHFLAEVLEVQVHDKKSREPPDRGGQTIESEVQEGQAGSQRSSVATTDEDERLPEDKVEIPEEKAPIPGVPRPSLEEAEENPIEPRPLAIAKRLLVSLTDIQAITGLAMILTGMARYPSITYYHEQFASNLWWLTLNSLWVSRIDYNENTPFMSTWRMQIRRVTITSSVVVAAIFQIIIALREENKWDPLKAGHCYVRDDLGSDFAQNIFWFLGTCIYGIVLILSLTKPTRTWYDVQIVGRIEPSLDTMWTWLRSADLDLTRYRHSPDSPFHTESLLRREITTLFLSIRVVSYTAAFVTWWCLVQFLSIWSSGTGSHAVELAVYSVFAVANTWWVIALKVDNVHLVVGNESKWTFGQMLPCALALLVGFYFADACDEIPKHSVLLARKRDEEAQREGLMLRRTRSQAAPAQMEPDEKRNDTSTS